MTLTVPSWINKPADNPPEWLAAHSSGGEMSNGSFLIKSRHGQARVHSGAVVFEYAGTAYTCPPEDAPTMLAELKAACASPPPQDPGSLPPLSAREAGAAAGQRRFAAPKGRPPSIEMRHPDELFIDDSYQRSIDTGPSRALINRIAVEWDWRMCMPLVVSRREDDFYVIDGQHRLAAAKLRGDIPFLPCCVATYAGVADEAAMFVAMNRSRRAINRLDDFHAAKAGGDADTIAIAALIEGVGFTVSRRTGSAAWVPGEVAFTSAIAAVRRKHGDGVCTEALKMMADAFPDERLTAGSSIFTSICKLLITPPPAFDRDRLFKALLTFDMVGWASFLKGAKGGDDRERRLREMLLAAYEDAVAERSA